MTGPVGPVKPALGGNSGAAGGRKGIRHQAIEGLSDVRAVAAAEHLGVDVERCFRVLVADLAHDIGRICADGEEQRDVGASKGVIGDPREGRARSAAKTPPRSSNAWST